MLCGAMLFGQNASGTGCRIEADGNYSLDHLRPGDYTIIAIPKAAFFYDFIADCDDQMDEFSIHGDEKVSKDLKLARFPAP